MTETYANCNIIFRLSMKKGFFLLIILLILTSFAISKEISGIDMPETLKSGNVSLTLNGAGIIKKLIFKVYAIGMFFETKSSDANAIMYQDKPYIIRMHFLRTIGRDKMVESMNTGFYKSTGGKPETLKKEIDQLNTFFSEKELKEDQILQFEYIPGTGTKITLDGKLKGNIPGFPFKRALIGIWLGSDPRDESVKQKLLGKE